MLLIIRPWKKSNSSFAPNETINDIKKAYEQDVIETSIRIIEDSLKTMHNTKNIETLCSRYEIGLKNCYTLKELEQAGLYKKAPTADDYIELFLSGYFQMIKDCYDRNLSEVKTESGKSNRNEKFFNSLKECVDEYTFNDIKKYIES